MNRDKLIKRAGNILQYLQGRLNERVPIETLVKELNKNCDDSVSRDAYRAAAYYLKNFMCPRGFDISVYKDGLELQQVELTSYMQRTSEQPELKTGLGYVLWNWLLNIRPRDQVDFEHESRHYHEQVLSKLAALRDRAMISVIADAGSTVHAVVHALLDVGPIPITPRIAPPRKGEPDERDKQCRFITPHIVTNSLSIATMIAESKYADSIPMTLIGGRFDPHRSSIAGPMTDQCVLSWGGSGSWMCDLAIIGTTGSWPQANGTIGFACEDSDEAQLKATLLKMAFFRIVVIDSSKIKRPPSGRIFAPMSATAIDLLVMDDGHSTGAKEEVDALSAKANKAGVSLLVLKTASIKSGRAAESGSIR